MHEESDTIESNEWGMDDLSFPVLELA